MGFRAVVIDQTRDGRDITSHSAALRSLPDAFLTAGPAAAASAHAASAQPNTGGLVDIAVEYSSLNYKDAMALAGRPGIVAVSPLIPGIDLAGTVTSSADQRFRAGDRVVLNGAGAGERMHGGFAERARVPASALVHLNDSLTTRHAAAIGTAGFTAMLSVLALEHGGVTPDADLPVLVTGATGGVGSIAIAILAHLGYHVTALTGRRVEHSGYLHRLGAEEIIDRAELTTPGRPLQTQNWSGVVDAVGGTVLANAIAQTRYGGTVTACGLVHSPDLAMTVLPFILRGVHLAGINSVDAPLPLREEAWHRLARDLDGHLLDDMTEEVPLDEVIALAEPLLAGNLHGRTVVRIA